MIIDHINAQLIQERERLRALYEMGLGVASRLDPDHHIEVMLREVRRLLNCDATLFLVADEGRSQARKKLWSGEPGGLDGLGTVRLNQGIVAEAIAAGEAVTHEEVVAGRAVRLPGRPRAPTENPTRGKSMEGGCPFLAAGFKAVVAAPVRVRGYLFGVMVAVARKAPRFTRNDLMLLSSVANLAADALENARLYRRVQEMAMVEERERIGMEMHDGLAQTIGYLNLKTKSLE